MSQIVKELTASFPCKTSNLSFQQDLWFSLPAHVDILCVLTSFRLTYESCTIRLVENGFLKSFEVKWRVGFIDEEFLLLVTSSVSEEIFEKCSVIFEEQGLYIFRSNEKDWFLRAGHCSDRLLAIINQRSLAMSVLFRSFHVFLEYFQLQRSTDKDMSKCLRKAIADTSLLVKNVHRCRKIRILTSASPFRGNVSIAQRLKNVAQIQHVHFFLKWKQDSYKIDTFFATRMCQRELLC